MAPRGVVEAKNVLLQKHGSSDLVGEVVGMLDSENFVRDIEARVMDSINIRTVNPEALDHGGLAEAREAYTIWVDVRNVGLDQNESGCEACFAALLYTLR